MRGLASLSLCALVLAACSSDEEGPQGSATVGTDDEEPSLVGVADRTLEERARFSLDATIEGLGDPIELTASGTADFPRDRSRMELDFSEIAQAGGAATAAADWRGEAVYVNDRVFVRIPGLTKALPEHVDWLLVDADTLAEQAGPQFNAPDPGEFVTFVDAIADDAEVVGEEAVGEADTTHFRGTVDVDELPSIARPDDRVQLASYARRLKTAGIERFPLDVWVDDEGLVRRLRTEYEGYRTGGPELTLLTTVELYDFGIDATIESPPRSRVTPLDELIGRGAEETEHTEPGGS
jgi:hypothetical protein